MNKRIILFSSFCFNFINSSERALIAKQRLDQYINNLEKQVQARLGPAPNYINEAYDKKALQENLIDKNLEQFLNLINTKDKAEIISFFENLSDQDFCCINKLIENGQIHKLIEAIDAKYQKDILSILPLSFEYSKYETIKIFDNDMPIRSPFGATLDKDSISFSHVGKLIFFSGIQKNIYSSNKFIYLIEFDQKGKQNINLDLGPQDKLTSANLSADGKYIITTGINDIVRIFKLLYSNGKVIGTMPTLFSELKDFRFADFDSKVEHVLLKDSKDHIILCSFDWKNLAELKNLQEFDNCVAPRFSNDGKYLAYFETEKEHFLDSIRIWDLNNKQSVAIILYEEDVSQIRSNSRIRVHNGEIGLTFSHDNQFLAGLNTIYNLKEKKVVKKFKNYARSFDFSVDNRYLLIAEGFKLLEQDILIWNIAKDTCIRTIRQNYNAIFAKFGKNHSSILSFDNINAYIFNLINDLPRNIVKSNSLYDIFLTRIFFLKLSINTDVNELLDANKSRFNYKEIFDSFSSPVKEQIRKYCINKLVAFALNNEKTYDGHGKEMANIIDEYLANDYVY